MSDSVRPHIWQPTRLPRPWDSPGKNTELGCYFLLQCMKVKSESEVTQSCPTLMTPWATAYQAPPYMGFSRQKYWSGVPLISYYMHAYSLGYLKASQRYMSVTELLIFPQKCAPSHRLPLRKWHLHLLSLSHKHLESTLLPLYLSLYV